MVTLDNFIGLWLLQSEQSDYQLGEPPVQGSYQITRDGDKLTFTMRWTDSDNQLHELAYSEQCDGQQHAYSNPEVADSICLTFRDDGVLASTAHKNGQLVLAATRELLSATKMRIVMSGPLPDGQIYRNVSMYSRKGCA